MFATFVLLAAAQPAPWLPPPPRLPASAVHGPRSASSGTKILYLNFGGGTVYNDQTGCSNGASGCSFIVNLPGMIRYPSFRGTAAQKQLIIDLVKSYYEPFDVQIVTDPPTSGTYSMNLIGGTPDVIGLGTGIVGIAPLDCSDVNDRDLTFTFPQVVANDPLEVAQTIAQETAHAYGLGHTGDRTDVMFPTVQKDANGFQNYRMIVPDRTDCTGTGYQNSYQQMIDNVGASPPDTEPPTISFVDPMDGVTLPSGFMVTLDAQDNRSVHDVELWSGSQMIARSTMEPWVLQVASGTLPGGTTQLRGLAHDRAGNQGEVEISVTLKNLGQTPGDLGNPCQTSSDCNMGGSCASPAGSQVCTRSCGVSQPCPQGFNCTTTEQFLSQCARPAADSGCNVGSGPMAPTLPALLVLLVLIDRYRRFLLRKAGRGL